MGEGELWARCGGRGDPLYEDDCEELAACFGVSPWDEKAGDEVRAAGIAIVDAISGSGRRPEERKKRASHAGGDGVYRGESGGIMYKQSNSRRNAKVGTELSIKTDSGRQMLPGVQ